MISYAFCKFIFVYYAFIFFFDILCKELVIFSFCLKNLVHTKCLLVHPKCLKVLFVLDKIVSFFCIDVVAMAKILPIGI